MNGGVKGEEEDIWTYTGEGEIGNNLYIDREKNGERDRKVGDRGLGRFGSSSSSDVNEGRM